jgi:hypothetical protein
MAENEMNLTRRSLLQWSGCVAAAAGAAGACGPFTVLKTPAEPLENLSAESFQPFAGHTLIFARPVSSGSIVSRTVELKLAKVERHERIAKIESKNPANYGERSRPSFSLLFELKNDEPLSAGLHRLVHGDFDGHQIFLSPVAQPRPDGTLVYEAVFG